MTKSKTALPPSGGIFSPQWHHWRGATLRIELEGEPPFLARLDAVRDGKADVTELDAAGRPTAVRELPWPPPGTIRVLRSP